MLTPEIVKELRKPFAPEQIKWKVQTNPKDGDDWAIVVAYVDARDVTERLDLATGGEWANEYTVPQAQAGAHHTLECRLTVCGITRCDVGSVPPPRDGDDATKDLYSDALKRAAVQFGVSSHIYRFPTVKAKVQKFGRSFFLTFKAQDELSDLNRHLIAGTRWPKYTEIKVSGDSFGANGKPELFDDKHVSGNGASYTNPVTEEAAEPPQREQPAKPAEPRPESPRAQKIARAAALLNDAHKAGVKVALDKPLAKQSDAELDITINKVEVELGMTASADVSEEWDAIEASSAERKVRMESK